LRNGGKVFSLKEMLGHTDLKMTARYVAIAQADVQNQHAKFSPVDRLRKSGIKAK
jgi:site-specific recombinase XerD